MTNVTPSIVTQIVQFGVEQAYGVAVPADKIFSAMGIDPTIETDIKNFRAAGAKYSSLTQLNKEHTVGPVDGLLTYTEAIYALASAVGNMQTTPVADSDAFLHTFHSKNRGRDRVASYTIEKGDPGIKGRRATGCIFNELSLKFDHNDGVTLGGAIIGKAMQMGVQITGNEIQSITITGGPATSGTWTATFSGQDAAGLSRTITAAALQTALEGLSNIEPGDVICTEGPLGTAPIKVQFTGQYAQINVPSITAVDTFDTGDIAVTTPTAGAAPTEVALQPVLSTEINIYLDDDYASIGTTLLEGVISVEFSLTGRQSPFWPLGRANGSGFNKLLESVPEMKATLLMANDDDADELVTAMRTGAKKYLRVDAEGPIADADVPYGFGIDLALAISDHSGFSEEDPAYAAGIELMAINPHDWSQSNEFRVTNLLAGL